MPENHLEYQERLVTLRKEIKKSGLDGFILPRTDEFQGEFLAEYAERLAWLTGFTGSAGACVILADSAAVLSDGRYSIQLKNQVDSDLYDIQDITKISMGEWLASHALKGAKIGYDMWLITPKQLDKIKEKIEGKGIELVPMEVNPIDNIWHNQPARPANPITIFPDNIAGRSSKDKRAAIAREIKNNNCAACLITVSDSICWLLNIRGGDVPYSPLVLSYALLYADGSLDWFVAGDKNLDGVNIFPFDQMAERISRLQGNIWLDRASAPIWFEQAFTRAGLEIIDRTDPCLAPKSIKSATEQKAVRKAHIQDGVAMVKFLKWIDESAEPMSEISVEEKLEGFRRENKTYLGASFPTIAGFAENGAIVHYRATKQSDKTIQGNSLLLVDSGGQYEWGTTDITRTMAIGTPSQKMREHYTLVLKGHIALASARFPKGTVGKDIDALARKPLQDVGLDYAHGTGHGVGCYLCVHEYAANISTRSEVEFEVGMLISNEPGYYREGEYGIRIESLVLVMPCNDAPNMMRFDTVTLAPLEHNLIDNDMLDAQEIAWLAAYSNDIYKKLSHLLSDSEKAWLKSN